MAYIPDLFARATDVNGSPISGAKRLVFEAGTTTPVTTYSDVSQTTPQAAALVSDAAGLFATSFLPSGVYKVRVTDAADVTIVERDNIRVADRPDDPVFFDDEAAVQADSTNFDTGTVIYGKNDAQYFLALASGSTLFDFTNAAGEKFVRINGTYATVTALSNSNEGPRGAGAAWVVNGTEGPAVYTERASGTGDITNAAGVELDRAPGFSTNVNSSGDPLYFVGTDITLTEVDYAGTGGNRKSVAIGNAISGYDTANGVAIGDEIEVNGAFKSVSIGNGISVSGAPRQIAMGDEMIVGHLSGDPEYDVGTATLGTFAADGTQFNYLFGAKAYMREGPAFGIVRTLNFRGVDTKSLLTDAEVQALPVGNVYALGATLFSGGDHNTLIGSSIASAWGYSIAIGRSIDIGYDSGGTLVGSIGDNGHAIALGDNTRVSGVNGIAIGQNAAVDENALLAIGEDAVAEGLRSASILAGTVTGTNQISIGDPDVGHGVALAGGALGFSGLLDGHVSLQVVAPATNGGNPGLYARVKEQDPGGTSQTHTIVISAPT